MPGDGGLYYVGMVAWVAFGVLVLVTLGYTLALGVRTLRRRAAA